MFIKEFAWSTSQQKVLTAYRFLNLGQTIGITCEIFLGCETTDFDPDKVQNCSLKKITFYLVSER